jgi:hypothetical protein
VSAAGLGELLSTAHDYTRRTSDKASASSLARARAHGTSAVMWAEVTSAERGRAIRNPEFPTVAARVAAPASRTPRTMAETFEFGVGRVLDGMAQSVNEITAKPV